MNTNGVLSSIKIRNGNISGQGTFVNTQTGILKHCLIKVDELRDKEVIIKTNRDIVGNYTYAFVQDVLNFEGQKPNYTDSGLIQSTELKFTIPSNANYLYLLLTYSNITYKVTSLTIEGVEYLIKSRLNNIDLTLANLDEKILNAEIAAKGGYDSYPIFTGWANSDMTYMNSSNKYIIIPVTDGDYVEVLKNSISTNATVTGLLQDYGDKLLLPAAKTNRATDNVSYFVEDANFLFVGIENNDENVTPESIRINGVDAYSSYYQNIKNNSFSLKKLRIDIFQNRGLLNNLELRPGNISASINKFLNTKSGLYRHYLIPVKGYSLISVDFARSVQYTFVQDAMMGENSDVHYADGYTGIVTGLIEDLGVPVDATYLYVLATYGGIDIKINSIIADGTQILQSKIVDSTKSELEKNRADINSLQKILESIPGGQIFDEFIFEENIQSNGDDIIWWNLSSAEGKWVNQESTQAFGCVLVNVEEYRGKYIKATSDCGFQLSAFLKSNNRVSGQVADFCEGTNQIKGYPDRFLIPDDASYFYMTIGKSAVKYSYTLEFYSKVAEQGVVDYKNNFLNHKKRIAVFGGSHSANTDPSGDMNIMYDIWREILDAEVDIWGVCASGYAKNSHTSDADSVKEQSYITKTEWKWTDDEGIIHQGEVSAQGQIDQACSDSVLPYDIYVLFGSTNDFNTYTNVLPGDRNSYTIDDEFSEESLNTQNGGISYCVKKILQKNPKAQIVLFSSMRFFASFSDRRGWDSTSDYRNSAGFSYFDYKNAQKEIAERFNIPVLDLWNIMDINEYNYKKFYYDDLHLNVDGIVRLAYKTGNFLKNCLS